MLKSRFVFVQILIFFVQKIKKRADVFEGFSACFIRHPKIRNYHPIHD
mgnify:CR=1 FL=1